MLESPFRETSVSGLVVIDKPTGLTSHDVVARVRRISGTKRVGHTGTLDPMATGVLVLCLGKATRLIPFIEEEGKVDAKEYEAVIRFGFETTTDDALGEPRGDSASLETLTERGVSEAIAAFVGESQQVPPDFSAKKVGGKRAYAMARKGEELALKPVTVHVGAAQLLRLEGDRARVRFACSRGTYIRGLARDLGRALGVGAHLVGLRRTRTGVATLDKAIALDDLSKDALSRSLIPMANILDAWPRVVAGARQCEDIRLGRPISLTNEGETKRDRVRVCDLTGGLVALANRLGPRIQPFCVF